jgi:putative membrane protein
LTFASRAIWLHSGHAAPDSGFTAWQFEPTLLAAMILGVGLYLFVVGPHGKRRRLGPPVSRYRIVAFMSGLLVIFVALASPIDSIGEHYLFSIHMVQHLTLMFVAAPLITVGIPPWAIRLLPYSKNVHSATRFLTLPMVAFLVSSGVFLIWHAPPFYEGALENSVIHEFEHISILAVGILMWWPALSPVRALPALSVPAQLLYFFVLPIPTSIVGALITFAGDPLYSSYADAPRLWGLSASLDQEIAGLLMWVPGKLIFWTAMGIAFFRWFSDEDAPDPPRLSRNL